MQDVILPFCLTADYSLKIKQNDNKVSLFKQRNDYSSSSSGSSNNDSPNNPPPNINNHETKIGLATLN